MAVAQGYGKIVTSGSVFAYDVGDTRNSYIGEPATNLVPYSEYQHVADNYTEALGGWDTHEGTLLIDLANKVPGYTNRSIKLTCIQANVYKYHFSVSLTTGQTYTVSFWGKATTAGQYGNFLLADGPGGYLVFEPGGYSDVTTEFKRFTYTFTVSSATGTYNFATYLYGDGQTAWLTGFQLENKNHATQYLPSNGGSTTRSATQGLLPLIGSNTLDLSNVSFDSNAQMTFDGTNDYISTSNSSLIHGTSNWTYSAVLKFAGTPSLGTVFENGSWGNCLLIRFQTNGFSIYSMSSYWGFFNFIPTLDAWYSFDFIRNGNAVNFYVNGSFSQQISFTANVQPSSNLYIGMSQHAPGQCFNGNIPVAKIYNRALTAAEVNQNYRHYKTRFNLS